LEITANTATTVEIYGLELEYDRNGASLEVASLQQLGTESFIPLDDALTTGERPLTPGVMYALHENARHLYARTGQAISCAYPEDTTAAEQVITLPVPEGAETLLVWVYAIAGLTSLGTLGITINGSTMVWGVTSNGWYGHSATVTGLSQVVVSYVGGGAGVATHSACSAYWLDRDTTVYAVTLLVDESGNFIVDEDGNNIRS
jgi:hypothetical protein